MIVKGSTDNCAALQRLTVTGSLRIEPGLRRNQASLKNEFRRWGARGIVRMHIGECGQDGVFWLAAASRTSGDMEVKTGKHDITVTFTDAQFAVFLSPQTRLGLAQAPSFVRCDGLEGVHGVVAYQDIHLTGRLQDEGVDISERWRDDGQPSKAVSGNFFQRLLKRQA